jgi:hypothetical protein
VALLELIRDELGEQGQPAAVASRSGISMPGTRPGAQDDRLGRQLEQARRHQARARHAIIVLALTEVAAVASIAACLAALIWHTPGLAVLAGLAAADVRGVPGAPDPGAAARAPAVHATLTR